MHYKTMVNKKVKCPKCQHIIEIQGNPGEKIAIVCPKCSTKGVYIFPKKDTARDLKEEISGNIAIQVRSLSKTYNSVKAAQEVSFNVKKGEIFGFLGPNGAGKTTTIKMILGLTHPTAGEVYINGRRMHSDNVEVKKEIGYLPERISFYLNLTPVQTLNFFCELKEVNKSVVPEILKELGLQDVANRKVGTFSKGMIQLLGFAQAMIGSPSIYVLDEPSSGLDPRWMKVIRDKIRYLNEKGATVMFSSHILSEVQALCDRVCIINKGLLVAEDTIENLNKKLNIKPKLIIKIKEKEKISSKDIEDIEGVYEVQIKDEEIIVACDGKKKLQIIEDIKKIGIDIKDFQTIEPSIEDVFVKLLEGKNECQKGHGNCKKRVHGQCKK